MKLFGNWFFFNDSFLPASEFSNCIKQNQNRIYEVLRVVNGQALFIIDHLERFQQSCKEINLIHSYSDSFIISAIENTITKNNIGVCNIRFEVLIQEKNLAFACFLVPWSYPPELAYQEGVSVGSYEIERPNPHIKQSLVNNKVRSELELLFSKNAFYEVLLIDHNGNITEGSRSNVFFVKNQLLYSPPSEKILEGITRKKVLNLARKNNIGFVEQNIALTSAYEFDACFITGTSPKILPVKSLNAYKFDVTNKLVERLMNLLNELIIKQTS